jgi:hypothetical protein
LHLEFDMKSLYIIAAALLLSAVSPASLAQSRVIELSYEISPSLVRMPDSDNGELTAQSCATCKVLRLRASPDTRYTIGNQLVTRAEMTKVPGRQPGRRGRRHAAQGHVRPHAHRGQHLAARAVVRGKNHETHLTDSLYARRSRGRARARRRRWPTTRRCSRARRSRPARAPRPNVLFVIDTSGSMDSEVTVYDPAQSLHGYLRRQLRVLG